MRVHRLAITAFGPYAETVRVDLDQLSRDGLFLVCGPTGAGKTSLLDAITFALFNRVPGARGQEKRSRSDHALVGVRTAVECEVTLRGERLRILRKPEQVRPKARGAGTTRDQASVVVERQAADGTWSAVASRLDEAGHFLAEAIGLSAEQFCQVALLPQGEFAAFLRAEPDQRAAVLETLFDAGRFTAVEQWLKDTAAQARTDLTEADARIDRLLHRIEQAAIGLSSVPGRPDPAADALGYLATLIERARTEVESTRLRRRAAEESDDAVAAARTAARPVLRALRVLAATSAHDAVLRGRAAELDGSRAWIESADRAEPLRHGLAAQAAAALARSRAADQRQRAWRAVLELDIEHTAPSWASGDGPDPADPAALRAWIRALRDEHSRLTDLASMETELVRDLATREELRAESTGLADAIAGRTQVLNELPALLADLGRRRDETSAAAARRMAAVAGRTALAARLTAAERSEILQREADQLGAAVGAARESMLAAKQRWLDLREARLAGYAAELARDLRPGEPCPVCGGAEHPQRAVESGTSIGAAEEDAARQVHERNEAGYAEQAEALAELRLELGHRRGLAGSADLPELRASARAAEADLERADAAVHILPGLAEELAERTRRGAEAQAEVTELTGRSARLEAQLEDLDRRITDRADRVDRARGGDPSLVARIDRVEALGTTAERALDCLAVEQRADAELAASTAELSARLAESGFTDADRAGAALLDPARHSTLVAEVREYEDARTASVASVAAAVADLRDAVPTLRASRTVPVMQCGPFAAEGAWAELAAYADTTPTGTAPPDPIAVQRFLTSLQQLADELDAARSAAVTALRAATAAAAGAEAAVDNLSELRVLLGQALAEAAPLRESTERVCALAALATGGGANTMRMPLRSYVLAARLEQVAVAAGGRLREMSGGRFGFAHSDDLRTHGRRSGLGLDILDAHTGTQRPTKTLSGGESFMAALALALGLADVVSAETGGVALDTLFIDEGFGSLDPESLDAVMGVLDELRRGGRVVGIVSHVEELRSRIPRQLHIRTSAQGSTIDPPADSLAPDGLAVAYAGELVSRGA